MNALSQAERKAMEATYGWQFDVQNRNQIEAQWFAAREFYTASVEAAEREAKVWEAAYDIIDERMKEAETERDEAQAMVATNLAVANRQREVWQDRVRELEAALRKIRDGTWNRHYRGRGIRSVHVFARQALSNPKATQ